MQVRQTKRLQVQIEVRKEAKEAKEQENSFPQHR